MTDREDADLQGTASTPDGRLVAAGSAEPWTVLLDDGTQLAVAPEALHRGGLRRVRPGQRLRLRLDRARAGTASGAEARVVAVALPTAPWPPASPSPTHGAAEGTMAG